MTHSINWPSLDDDAFVKEAKTQIWFSAFANNNPRAPAHKEVDAAYDEAVKRGKPWLYKKAWNKAYRSCGYEPNEQDILGETEEGYRALHPQEAAQ